MSLGSRNSAGHSTEPVHSPTTTSSGITDKYPVAIADQYQSYPEVAPSMTQPALETYQRANNGYPQPQYQQYNGYAPGGEHPPSSHKLNPWGLSPLSFGLLVAAITALIVGGAVGGGVAGAMSGSGSDSDSSR